jgi:hypothetical protein
MIAIETLGERGEDDPICSGDCLSADALDDSNWWQNDPFLTDLLNQRSRQNKTLVSLQRQIRQPAGEMAKLFQPERP